VSATIRRDVPVAIAVDAEDLAELFCDMDADEQARFLELVAAEFRSWGDGRGVTQRDHIGIELGRRDFDAGKDAIHMLRAIADAGEQS
jgi:hypothetical protein